MRRLSAVLIVGVALAAVTTSPYLAAALRPPAGAVFTGTFFYQDDYYQYLSFVEQASRGKLVFINKFDVRPQRPVVVNVEWWLGGVLAAVLGSPVAGFQALRLLAIAALVAAAARLLSAAGLAGPRLAGALALFATAGGLGWLRLRMGTPGWRVPDILLGLFPFHQSLMNTHFVTGTALLLWTVVLYLEYRAGRRRAWWWVAAGMALGLSRPYELVVFVLVSGALIALDLARRRIRWKDAVRAGLRLAWLAPVFLYYAALMLGPAGVEGWTGVRSGDLSPPRIEVGYAVLPAFALVAAFWRKPAPADPLGVRRALAVWAAVVVMIVVGYPSPMAKQFATSLGPAVVLLAALVTPARWIAPAVAALCPTSVFLLWRVLNPYVHWFAPRDEIAAVQHLEGVCRAGDVALAPSDLSLRIAGLTPCSVAFGHRCLTPDWPDAVEAGRRFYDPATAASWRAEYVRKVRARFVFLPPGAASWLGEEHRLVRRLSFAHFEVWEVADQNRGG